LERKSFIMYQSYEEQINCLPPEERGLLFSAIFEYFRTGELSEPLPFGANIIFIGIRSGLDRDHEKYEKMCERNKENAKKAGRPKKIQSIFEKTDNDNENDNENENDNDNDNENDNGNGNGNGDENEAKEPQTAPPTLAPKTPSKKEIREEEKEELINAGVPLEYIEEREERLTEYAKKEGKSFPEVVMDWWKKDEASFKRRRERKEKNAAFHSKEKSYDTDAFFEASMNRAFEEFEKKYGGGG